MRGLDNGVTLERQGSGGGRCGGSPPAQGRAEGLNAKRQGVKGEE